MRYFDRNTDASRYPDHIAPVIRGLLENRQIFGPDQEDPPYVMEALKYSVQQQDRRATSPYDGDDPFVESILDIFGFEPLDFQIESWQTVDRLDEQRREDGRRKSAIFSAPTGFGKTEAFLGPLYQLLLDGRQEGAAIVYPSRALLQDQLKRILKHVYDIRESTGMSLSVGLYVGNQPWEMNQVEGSAFFERGGGYSRFKLANCWCSGEGGTHNFEYRGSSQGYILQCENDAEHRFSDRELVLSRRDLVFNNNPDILLTTLESLEGFAHKPHYPLIRHLDTVVLDEVHLYTQLRGAHAAKIIENVNSISESPLLWIGSSATIDDATRFGTRIFGIDNDSDIETVAPPDNDFVQDHTDKEHYYFLLTPDGGPGVSSMSIQQYMLLGHTLLEDTDGERGKLLGFIDSISQVNQKKVQLEDADRSRELWRYHTDAYGNEDWEGLARAMGTRFIDEPLDILPVYSDQGFDSAEAAESDILLSTSFLEVGIDVGEIKVITQYRTPWNLSSFLQRSGRAARIEGMDAHIAVFLSNLTDDANMFYRAERFLSSEIRTPIKTDNPVVEWIHEKFQQYYRRADRINDERYRSEYEEHRAFLEGYLVIDLGFEPVHDLIIEPAEFFEARMSELPDVPNEPLLSPDVVDETIEALDEYVANRGERFSDIEAYFDMDGGNVVRGSDAIDSYVTEVQARILDLIQTLLGQAQGYRRYISDNGADGQNESGENIEAMLNELRAEAAEIPEGTADEKLTHYSDLIARVYGVTGQMMQLRSKANRSAEGPIPQVKTDLLDEAKQAVDQLEALTEDDQFEEYYNRQREMFYLKAALEELQSYLDSYGKPFMSLYSVKDLLRCTYYVDRYLQTRGTHLANEVWFVPPDYYGSSGQFMTVFRGDDNRRQGTEEPIDKIVGTFTPYRSEYQSEAGVMQAFLPQTTVTDDGVEFVYDRDVTGQERDGILIPDSIQTRAVKDLADAQALNIIRYCPVCLQVISDMDVCLRHDEKALGKIHADAQVDTTVTDRANESNVGGLTLADVGAEVTLDGVSLEITPAEYMGQEIGYRFTGDDRISREITSPDVPIGFRIDTRGLVFDLSSFLDGISEMEIEHVERYNDLDDVGVEYLAYHTAAHFFLQLVADVSSVNTTNLLYGFDRSKAEVYVFERTEGGQGIVDLVFEELRTDPASVLESLTRVAYNPQVINERLWTDRGFVAEIPEEGDDEDALRNRIEERVGMPYPEILDQTTQECIATIDRCRQFAADSDITLQQAYTIKVTVAQEQIEGTDEFPRERLMECVGANEENIDRIKTLFYSPDIDGCVENLQLTECMASREQGETLSYVLLEALRSHLLEAVPKEMATETMFDRELPPAGEFDGTSVFLNF